MPNDQLPEDWKIIRSWLPEDLDALARRHGFTSRSTGLQDVECWLRLILMHVAGGLSLKQTVVRAGELGLAKLSSVALFKRMRKAEGWLQSLAQYVLKEQRQKMGQKSWPWRETIRVVDATTIEEPGATGTSWRVHYSLRLPDLACDHYELTDAKGGEKLGRFIFKPGEIVLADRGYCHRAGAAQVIDSDASLIMRWQSAIFPLEDASESSFKAAAQVRKLKIGEIREWPVWFRYQNKTYALRLCAMRKSQVAAERSISKARRKAHRNGTQIDEKSLELHHYILVLTSLSQEKMEAGKVLEFYRGRWQVELAFKRLKSLLQMGHVPKTSDDSARAWMQAKLLFSLILERVVLEGRFFSPWGYRQ